MHKSNANNGFENRGFINVVSRICIRHQGLLNALSHFPTFLVLKTVSCIVNRYVHKEDILAGMRLALGKEMSLREIKSLMKKNVKGIRYSMSLLLVLFSLNMKKGESGLLNRTTLPDTGVIDEALRKGTGAIIVSGHIFSPMLITVGLAYLGYQVNMVEDFFRTQAERDFARNRINEAVKEGYNLRLNLIRVGDARSDNLEKLLRENQIVILFVDYRHKQNRKDDFTQELFGLEVRVGMGAAALALKTGAPVIPVFTHCEGNKILVDIEKPILANGNMDIHQLASDIYSTVREAIYEYPEQWMLWSKLESHLMVRGEA